MNCDSFPVFDANYESVKDFEQQYDFQLSEDIAVLLTPA